MFKFIKLFAAAVPLLAASLAYSSEIAGSKHDFSWATWSDNQICKPCHTPHNGDISLTGRIWAHEYSSAVYKYHGGTDPTSDKSTSTDIGNKSAQQTEMDNASRLCLSCHDGTVALDSFMGKDGGKGSLNIKMGDAGSTKEAQAGYNPNLTTDLSNDHPVGYRAMYKEDYQPAAGHFVYNPTANVLGKGLKLAVAKNTADTTSALPASYVWRTGDVNPATGQPYTAPTQSVSYYSVSCVTCHNVHNSGASEERGLLRISNVGSDLCLTCHNK